MHRLEIAVLEGEVGAFDEVRPSDAVEQTAVRRITQLFHPVQPVGGLGVGIGHAAIDDHQVAARFQHAVALPDEGGHVAEMMRRDAAGNEVERFAREGNFLGRENRGLGGEAFRGEQLTGVFKHRRGQVADDRRESGVGQRQRGVAAAGGDVEGAAGFRVSRDECQQLGDIAGVGEEVFLPIVIRLPVELPGGVLLLEIERHGGASVC